MYVWGHGGRVVTLSLPTSSGKAGSCLLLVGSLQLLYGTLTNCMYWFPLPIKLPFMI